MARHRTYSIEFKRQVAQELSRWRDACTDWPGATMCVAT